MSIIQTEKNNTVGEFRENVNSLSNIVGDISNLTGFSVTPLSVIGALKELESEFVDIVGNSPGVIAVNRVINGAYDWSMSIGIGTGTIEKPNYILYSKNLERVKMDLIWSINNNITSVAYNYSSNSGDNYSLIKTESFVYDVNENLETISWS